MLYVWADHGDGKGLAPHIAFDSFERDKARLEIVVLRSNGAKACYGDPFEKPALPKNPLTVGQLQWCRRHDWGQVATLHEGRIHNLLDCEVHADGHVSETWVTFDNFAAIRAWAGY